MAFFNYKNLLERPFMVYADFESSLIPTEDSKKIHMHKANSACCYFVCTFDSSRNKLYNFIGENCVIDLLNTLKTLADSCIEEMRNHTKIIISKVDECNFKCDEQCYICNGEFTKSNYKVRDHCHRTGKYRGAAHTRCNINYYNNRFLPVVFHNLRGYDSHLILKEAFEICGTDKNIGAVPNSMEKFMSFNVGDVKFIDSFQFMASSLETLAKNLITTSTDKYEKFDNMKSILTLMN
jgi:hypothetical protein